MCQAPVSCRQRPPLQRSGEPCKSPLILPPSHRSTRCWEGRVCRGVPWHGKLVRTGSILLWCGVFGFRKCRRAHLLFAESHAPLWVPTSPQTIALLLSHVLFQWHLFLFLHNFFSFFFYVNYGRKVQWPQGARYMEDGQERPLSWFGIMCEQGVKRLQGLARNWESGHLGSYFRLCCLLLGGPVHVT